MRSGVRVWALGFRVSGASRQECKDLGLDYMARAKHVLKGTCAMITAVMEKCLEAVQTLNRKYMVVLKEHTTPKHLENSADMNVFYQRCLKLAHSRVSRMSIQFTVLGLECYCPPRNRGLAVYRPV